MGVKGLLPALRKLGCVPSVPWAEALAGGNVAIDATAWCYRIGKGFGSTDIAMIAQQMLMGLRRLETHAGMAWPAYLVVDGPPLPLKSLEQEKRRQASSAIQSRLASQTRALHTEAKCVAEAAYDDLDDLYQAVTGAAEQTRVLERAAACAAVHFSREDVEDCMRAALELAEKNGIDPDNLICVRAPAEAEAYACRLVRAGNAGSVLTTDSDALAFGAIRTIRAFPSHLTSPTDRVELLILDDVLRQLNMSLPELAEACVLAGCDWSPDRAACLAGLGIQKAFKVARGAEGGLLRGMLSCEGCTPPAGTWKIGAAERHNVVRRWHDGLRLYLHKHEVLRTVAAKMLS